MLIGICVLALALPNAQDVLGKLNDVFKTPNNFEVTISRTVNYPAGSSGKQWFAIIAKPVSEDGQTIYECKLVTPDDRKVSCSTETEAKFPYRTWLKYNIEYKPGETSLTVKFVVKGRTSPVFDQVNSSQNSTSLSDEAREYYLKQVFQEQMLKNPAYIADIEEVKLSRLPSESVDEFAFRAYKSFGTTTLNNTYCQAMSDYFIFRMRSNGIPARHVCGYTATLDSKKDYHDMILRGHIWTEYWSKDHWVLVDPTRAYQDQNISDFKQFVSFGNRLAAARFVLYYGKDTTYTYKSDVVENTDMTELMLWLEQTGKSSFIASQSSDARIKILN